MFADIANSTHLYEVYGDKVAQTLIFRCIECLKKVTATYQGTVIKTIGDEVLCTFKSPKDAIDAGKKMHQSLDEIDLQQLGIYVAPNIYIGIHYGPVIEVKGDIFGDTVNIASRMKSYAKQRQIITTEDTIKNLPNEYKSVIRLIDKTPIKGKTGETCIYEVIWEEVENITNILDSQMIRMSCDNICTIKLELTVENQSYLMNFDRPLIKLGRLPNNDIILNNNRVSRNHATIEFRRGKFFLIDKSTNGTYISIQGKKLLHIKRDEAILVGTGMIGLGVIPSANASETIYFKEI